MTFSEQLRQIIGMHPFTFAGESFTVTISLGAAAVLGEPAIEAAEIIRRADENLYEAKHRGRNQVVPSPVELPR